ncbi:plasmid partitioning protein RepB (plasmid) [Hoeflea sp. IMCC20628]|uniref:plasmid partitioning protein RepB n=1 Tax=Hoeflea sp. IMCC20628 TaxID=1620421 RepID=UPI00063AC48B|nr:plasmid partitioning protein RepB [Hoeflea sp. IMCC20628]AKI03428.1 plasmid partitioning protein RepB [Hoeflea sp. IMCC20628]
MSKRKDQLRSIFETKPNPGSADAHHALPMVPSDANAVETDLAAALGGDQSQIGQPAPRTSSGAVKAMGLALGDLQREAEDARSLRALIADGAHLVELDPGHIVAAPIADRLTRGRADDPDFDALIESIRNDGQQVPVLVRPHPDADKAAAGWYQLAYGHRRLAAAAELGLQVSALVKPLTDIELTLAQGRENAERRNLSFIERARFASLLIAAEHDRSTVMAALGVDKTELSRLVQVSERIPPDVIASIGPAPKTGRPRWMALAGLFLSASDEAKAREEAGLAMFRDAPSDSRFQMMFARLSKRETVKAPPAERIVADKDGVKLCALRLKSGKANLEFNEKAAPGLADWLADQLPELVEKFRQSRQQT